jgi:transcriptional regulator with XRE-family HTH domain
MSANEPGPISGAQCRAARAMTNVSRQILADGSGVDMETIEAFERGLTEPANDIRRSLCHALESLGATFMSNDAHGGPGVRLKFTLAEASRIDALENEGGPTGEDDVTA